MNSKRLSLKGRQNLLGYMFILPWIFGFLVFTLYPIVYSIFLSLQNVKITAEGIQTSFIGFENFQRAFAIDRVMLLSLYDFIKESVIMMLVINVFALLFAMILNMNIKGRGFFRVIFFLPVVVASGPVITELVNQEILVMPGIANFSVIEMFVGIFGDRFGQLIVDIFSQLIYMFWFSGVQIIVFLAILQKMSPETYEAAGIDGASGWEKFWKITLPALKPVILINLIYTFIMLATFDDNAVISEIKLKMFSTKVEEGFGYAAAQSWIYFLALLLVVGVLVVLFFVRRGEKPKVSFYAEGYVYNTTRYEYKDTFFNTNPQAVKMKKIVAGSSMKQGLAVRGFIYLLITVVSFAFLYPFITLLFKSFQSPQDVLDPTVGLIPSGMYTGNFDKAFKVIDFWNALKVSLGYSFFPALFQTLSCAVIGYGISRFNFRGKGIILGLIVATFIVPPQVTMIPTYLLYKSFGEGLTSFLGLIGIDHQVSILNSILSFLLPATFGQGIKSAIFILIFYQFFNMVPKVLDEAAEIDGAGPLRIFFTLALPLAVPAIIVVFLFSFVWYWNETYLTGLYIQNAKTLPIQLSKFAASFRLIFPDTGGYGEGYVDTLNESVYMAGTLLSILPLLVIYFALQHWFVQGVDRTGIAGE